MKGNLSALYSKYIIDGIPQRLTPAEILNSCLAEETIGMTGTGNNEYDQIVDESTDPDPSAYNFKSRKTQDYLLKTSELAAKPRAFQMAFSGPFTKSRIAKALLDALWMKGHFRLSDLSLAAKWKWESKPLGNMAAFYSSVEAAADYLDSLGICLSSYSFASSERSCQVAFKVDASERSDSQEDGIDDMIALSGDAPFGSEHPVIRRARALPDTLAADTDSWLIYIPFDSCDMRLGHSLLSEAFGENGDPFPGIGDGDYFIDCFEILREFVEDGVVISGATVGDGGMLTALKRMCNAGMGASIDINGIMNAYGEERSARILFSEVPGVLIQIKDIDYDYVDAELLLQDIAYYPIGHPSQGSDNIKIKADGNNGITDILQSLLNSQASEGED